MLRYGGYGTGSDRAPSVDGDRCCTRRSIGRSVPPDGIDLKALIAQALHMGDEGHNRNRAGTILFMRAIGPALARTNRK